MEIEKIDLDDHVIIVSYDEFIDSEMMQGGNNIQLHADERSLTIGDTNFAPKNYTLRHVLDNMAVDRLFVGDYGEHSGIWLRDFNEVTEKDIEDFVTELVKDRAAWSVNGDEDEEMRRDFVLDEYCLGEVVSGDITMIASREECSNSEIKQFWDDMDDYVRGQCYIVNLYKKNTCKCCDHESLDHIDGLSALGEWEETVEEVKKMID